MTTPHAEDERCFYCATDLQMERALRGASIVRVHMDLPLEACPNVDPGDFRVPVKPEAS
jgi:hypothetical protein